MPQPSRTQVHVDRPLSNLAIAYLNEVGYLFEQMPRIRVAKQGDKYFTFDKDFWFRDEVKKRAPGAESMGSGFEISTATYFCDEYAFHQMVDDSTRANADAPLNIDRDATRFVAHQMALDAEVQLAGTIIGQSVWASSGAPSTTWDNVASTPIEDVRAQHNIIIERTGYKPNAFIAGAEVYKRLLDHPDILDRVKYTQRGIVGADLLASLFDVDRFYVHYASRTTGAEGASSFTYDFLGNSGKNALLCYVDQSPGVFQPSAFAIFEWMPMTMSRFRMDLNRADRIEGNRAYDIKVTASDLGHEFTSAVAS